MTPRSSGPGGEYPPLRGTTNLRLTAYQHCNVTENCAGVLAAATSPANRVAAQLQTAWVTFGKQTLSTSRKRQRASARRRTYSRSKKRLIHSTSRPVGSWTMRNGLRALLGSCARITWKVIRAPPSTGIGTAGHRRRLERRSCWGRVHLAVGPAA